MGSSHPGYTFVTLYKTMRGVYDIDPGLYKRIADQEMWDFENPFWNGADEAPTLKPYTDLGGYPTYYVMQDHDMTVPYTYIYCADCASENPKMLESVEVHYEGPPLECDECGKQIESAYGDPDAEDEDGEDG